eukprot:evm.model.NODE_3377_length_44775_cov_49.092262.5
MTETASFDSGEIKRLVLVTDAWQPQVNGVVRTLNTTTRVLRALGVEVHVISPQAFNTVPCPTYPSIQLAVLPGRVAVEKNVEAFLALDLPGQKWVVGDGPALEGLQAAYPEVRYFGFLNQTELAKIYQQSSVFVFPSKTDTFGLVLLEAMATGLPVAAYPVSGPIDVVSTSAETATSVSSSSSSNSSGSNSGSSTPCLRAATSSRRQELGFGSDDEESASIQEATVVVWG